VKFVSFGSSFAAVPSIGNEQTGESEAPDARQVKTTKITAAVDDIKKESGMFNFFTREPRGATPEMNPLLQSNFLCRINSTQCSFAALCGRTQMISVSPLRVFLVVFCYFLRICWNALAASPKYISYLCCAIQMTRIRILHFKFSDCFLLT
jgi:hypothetical protein